MVSDPVPRVLDPRLIALVYAEYAKTSNLLAVTIYGLMLMGGQTAQIGRQPFLQSAKFFFFFCNKFPRIEKQELGCLDADLQQGETCGLKDGLKPTVTKARIRE